MNALETILDKLRGVQSHGDYFTALCPGHDDRRQSLSVREGNDGRVLLKCHAGCGTSSILAALGLKMTDLFPKSGERGEIEATYDYCDAYGKLAYQVVRFKPKSFVCRRPDGAGGWHWNLDGTERVLYRLPELLKEPGRVAFIAEGEKSVDAVRGLGLLATTNPHGAGKWNSAYNEPLRGRSVMILPDNDDPGRDHAVDVVKSLLGTAAGVRVLELPGLADKEDVVDWIARGGDRDKLKELANTAPDAETWLEAWATAKSQAAIGDDAHLTDMGNAAAEDFIDGKTFIPPRLGQLLLAQVPFVNFTTEKTTGRLYSYRNGVYKRDGAARVAELAGQILGDAYRDNRVEETTRWIEMKTRTDPERANQHDGLINVRNGMFDWRTGELSDHDPAYLSTIQIPVTYDPAAKCPEIEEFLLTTLPADCIELTFEFLGYLLIPSTRYQKALMVVGPGSNGKSTFLDLVKTFLGSENVSNVPIQDLSEHRFKRAELQGKLANIFADLDAAALKASSYFKMIVTGDDIDAERKYSHPFAFKPFARLIFSANAMPASYDKSQAFYRRWLIVPFPNRFEGEDADPDILAKMTTSGGLSGLLNLAVKYLRQLTERGRFDEPETVVKAMSQYKQHSDPMTAFLEECCAASDTKAEVGKTELYEAYLKFCEGSKVKYTEPRAEFNRRLQEMFPDMREERKRTEDKNLRIWVGGPALANNLGT